MKHTFLVALFVLAACNRHASSGVKQDPAARAALAPGHASMSVVPSATIAMSVSPPIVLPSSPCASTSDDAVASPDGRTTVFASTDPSKTGPSADVICIARDGGKPEVLLAGREGREDAGVEDGLSDFKGFVFSPDGRTLYFTSAAWTVDTAAHAIDLKTRKVRFMHAGRVLAVIDKGPYKNQLLVNAVTYDDEHPVGSSAYEGIIISWSVVTPSGKLVRRLPGNVSVDDALGTDIMSRLAEGT